jgi:hypothetical protein
LGYGRGGEFFFYRDIFAQIVWKIVENADKTLKSP